MKRNINRRDFIRISTLAGGGLLATAIIPRSKLFGNEVNNDQVATLDPCIRIYPNGKIVIRVFKQEMGQGAATGVAMIAAEEMEADWNDVSIELADFDKTVPGIESEYGRFDTGGSFSIEAEWEPMRKAGATVRELLRDAAANKWGISKDQTRIEKSKVTNLKTNETVGIGSLATAASGLPVPSITSYKTNSEYKIIGQPIPSIKAEKISMGQLKYSCDIDVDDMLHAMIIRPPVVGGKIESFDAKAAKAVTDIIDIFPIDPIERNATFCKGIKGGIAIVGKTTWSCMQAREMIQIKWNHGPNENRNSDDVFEEMDQLPEAQKRPRWVAGNYDQGIKECKNTITAEYQTPYLPHLLMEPLNSIAHAKQNGEIEIWAGTQSPQYTASNIAAVFGVPKSKITLHPYHMGGGNGRRYFVDFVMETVVISQRYHQPIKLLWSREDEIQHDGFHPLRKDYYEGGLDQDGNIHAIKTDAISTHEWGGNEKPLPYGHKHLLARHTFYDKKLLPWGSWRSVTKHSDNFPRECFIDELAYAAGKDPLQFRIDQIEQPISSDYKLPTGDHWQRVKSQIPVLQRIHKKLFEKVRDISDWDRPREKGVGLGVATESYHERSFCTQVAEVDVRDGTLKVSKVYCVIDCGLQINPSLVETQVEGGILWGLNPILNGGVYASEGRVKQSNFDDTPLMSILESPQITIKSYNFEDRPPCGAGEFAVPPIGPAVLNAVFAATGKRIRNLDLSNISF